MAILVIQILQVAVLLSVATTATSMRLAVLEKRAAQTNAVCGAEYAWANTLEGSRSPCLVAAQLLAPCNGGNWIVPALTEPTQAYVNPNSTTASPCSCSWAVYNLLSACSDCQGLRQAVRTWPDYKFNCPGAYLGNTTHYPFEFLPDDVSIPFWATTDPLKWTNSQYNIAQAKSIAGESHLDITKASSKRGPPVGPIVGGIVGGLALLIGIGIAYYLLQKRKREASDPASSALTSNNGPSMASANIGGGANHRALPPLNTSGYTTLTSDSGCGGVPTPITRTHSFSLVRSGSPMSTTHSTPISPLASPLSAQDTIDQTLHHRPTYRESLNPPAYDFSGAGEAKDPNLRSEGGYPTDVKREPEEEDTI